MWLRCRSNTSRVCRWVSSLLLSVSDRSELLCKINAYKIRKMFFSHGVSHDSSVGEWMCLTVSPLHALGHDSSEGEWMYLTLCPLWDPDHDSSVGEWMYLTVCPLWDPGHDSSVGEWMYLTFRSLSWPRVMIPQWENECISLSVLSVARVKKAQWENECIFTVWPLCSIPDRSGVFQGTFPSWSHSANPSVRSQRGRKWPISGTTQPVDMNECICLSSHSLLLTSLLRILQVIVTFGGSLESRQSERSKVGSGLSLACKSSSISAHQAHRTVKMSSRLKKKL